MRLELAQHDCCRVAFDISDASRDLTGTCSVGAIALAAESAASTGSGIACSETRRAFGAELDLAMLHRPRAGRVTATAIPASIGTDMHVWTIDVTSDDGNRVATGRCLLTIVDA